MAAIAHKKDDEIHGGEEELVPQKGGEEVQYEDDTVRLTTLELYLKKGTGESADPQHIPRSEIQHVSWGGDNVFEKTKHWWHSLFANKHTTQHRAEQEKRHNARFVIVASKYGGTAPVSVGFTIQDDPASFHKVLCPEKYAPAEGGTKESMGTKIRRSLSKENILAMASSVTSHVSNTGEIIKRTLSKDNLLSLTHGASTTPAAATASAAAAAGGGATDDRPLPPR